MLEQCTVETFQPHIGSIFHLEASDGPEIELELIEAEATGKDEGSSANDHRVPFTLLFRGPSDVALEQQIYHLEHDELARLDIFLVPIHPDEKGSLYEAIFT